jgi:hypothetical protein
MYAVALLRGRVTLFNTPVSINFSNQSVSQEEWSEEDVALWAKCLTVLTADSAPPAQKVRGASKHPVPSSSCDIDW